MLTNTMASRFYDLKKNIWRDIVLCSFWNILYLAIIWITKTRRFATWFCYFQVTCSKFHDSYAMLAICCIYFLNLFSLCLNRYLTIWLLLRWTSLNGSKEDTDTHSSLWVATNHFLFKLFILLKTNYYSEFQLIG